MKKKKVIKTNAVRMVEQAKVPYAIHEYDVDTAHLDAIHAAQGMGIPVEEVYKTIVLTGDKTGHLVACIAAHRELDLKTIAKVSGNKRVELLSLDKLEPLTGYVRGGCSPIGMKNFQPSSSIMRWSKKQFVSLRENVDYNWRLRHRIYNS